METTIWTMQQVIGHNVRIRRDQLGMTAAALGEKVGEAFGKAWPRQTVYLMENGERAMVAQEVVALSQILEIPLPQLLAPPAEVDFVSAGNLTVPADQLLEQGQDDQKLVEIARHLRALENAMKQQHTLVQEQYVLLSNARNTLRGMPPVEPTSGEGPLAEAGRMIINSASKHYKEDNKDG